MAGVRKWFIRNFVCRFCGHLDGVRMPFFVPWPGTGGHETGTIHCKRCGTMIGSY